MKLSEIDLTGIKLFVAILICGFFVQYVDINSWRYNLALPGLGYNLFIEMLYFSFFVPLLLLKREDWEFFFIGGLGVSLFNDITYGVFAAVWVPQFVPSLGAYYYGTWFRDFNAPLFTSDFRPLVQFTMTTGILWIYTIARFAIIAFLWYRWVKRKR